MKKLYKIAEFAKLVGVSVQTLRNWDASGALKPAKVDEENGYRYYTYQQFLEFCNNKTQRTLCYCRAENEDAACKKVEFFSGFNKALIFCDIEGYSQMQRFVKKIIFYKTDAIVLEEGALDEGAENVIKTIADAVGCTCRTVTLKGD